MFFAAVALRQTELKLAKAALQPLVGSLSEMIHPTEPEAEAEPEPEPEPAPMVSEGSLVFKEHLERLSVVMLVLLIGGTLFIDSWSWRAVGLALFLFLVARPLSVYIALLGTRTTWRIRGMTGWFGVRGIGSLYYLMYAIEQGLPEKIGLELIQLTLIMVTLSIVMHGISVKPLTEYFSRHSKDGSTP